MYLLNVRLNDDRMKLKSKPEKILNEIHIDYICSLSLIEGLIKIDAEQNR